MIKLPCRSYRATLLFAHPGMDENLIVSNYREEREKRWTVFLVNLVFYYLSVFVNKTMIFRDYFASRLLTTTA